MSDARSPASHAELDQLLREAAESGDCAPLDGFFRAYPCRGWEALPECLQGAFGSACASPAELPLLEWLCLAADGPRFSPGAALDRAAAAGNMAAFPLLETAAAEEEALDTAAGEEEALEAEALEALRVEDYARALPLLEGAPWRQGAAIAALCAERLEAGAPGGCPPARWVAETFGPPSPGSPAGALLELVQNL